MGNGDYSARARSEGQKVGRLEGFKVGRVQGRKVQGYGFFLRLRFARSSFFRSSARRSFSDAVIDAFLKIFRSCVDSSRRQGSTAALLKFVS
jgi:hypothetical protein